MGATALHAGLQVFPLWVPLTGAVSTWLLLLAAYLAHRGDRWGVREWWGDFFESSPAADRQRKAAAAAAAAAAAPAEQAVSAGTAPPASAGLSALQERMARLRQMRANTGGN
mmetsp:Transcript_31095/g.101350  ORF Transcript_31095/g.101350 Transcript_31095/m.101350 type:complete len:112 (-) Transcript_31095:541-876(-)